MLLGKGVGLVKKFVGKVCWVGLWGVGVLAFMLAGALWDSLFLIGVGIG